MRFLNPLLLAGLALAAVPIIIHLINRKRAVRRPIPTIEFLLRSERRMAKKLKVKQLLLLLLRVAVLVLLALAMSRPYLLSEAGVTADERLPTAVVFVLDDSFSMGFAETPESETAFTRAKAELLARLEALREWDQAALVLAREGPEAPVGQLDEDKGRVADAVEALVSPSPFATDIPAALSLAAEIHAVGELPRRRTVVLTDNAANGWGDELLAPGELAQLGELDVIEIRAAQELSNLALVASGARDSEGGGEHEVDLWVEVVNYGPTRREDGRIDLLLDEELAGSTLVELDAGERHRGSFTVSIPDGGLHLAEFRLVADGPDVAADNHQYLTVHRGRGVRALLVNGDPRNVPYRDELFYLERALNTGPEDRSAIAVDLVTVDSPEVPFEDFDVVVLANVAALPRARIGELVRFVREGGGLLFTLGDRVEPARYNDIFGELLPKPLRSIRALCEPSDPDANLLATRLARLDSTHPVFRVFDLPGGESIQSVSVYSYMLLEPSAAHEVETLASYGDGGPAIVERDLGAGRVALLTTSIDRDWTDLPIRTAFLPLARRLVRHLARRSGSEVSTSAVVGERHTIDVEAQNPSRVTVVDPNGQRFVLVPEGDERRVAFTPEVAGHHHVWLTIAGAERDFEEHQFAANLAPAESDLTRVADEIAQAYAEGASRRSSGDGAVVDVPERRISLWPLLIFLFILAIYVETGLAARRQAWRRLFSRLRRGRRGDVSPAETRSGV